MKIYKRLNFISEISESPVIRIFLTDLQFRITDSDPGGQLTSDPPDPDPEHLFTTGTIR